MGAPYYILVSTSALLYPASRENLKLLTQSILTNGWTLPIVVRPDYTIIDGFHRWTVSGQEPLLSKLGGKVPVVKVSHADEAGDIYGTITHNRARGTHLLEPMKAIVKRLLGEGKTVQEIGKQLGMRPEEVFRLSDFSRDDFLRMMAEGVDLYAPPLELCPSQQELPAPFLCGCFDAVKNGFLIDEHHGKQGGIYFPGLDQRIHQVGLGQAVLAPGEGHIHRYAIASQQEVC